MNNKICELRKDIPGGVIGDLFVYDGGICSGEFYYSKRNGTRYTREYVVSNPEIFRPIQKEQPVSTEAPFQWTDELRKEYAELYHSELEGVKNAIKNNFYSYSSVTSPEEFIKRKQSKSTPINADKFLHELAEDKLIGLNKPFTEEQYKEIWEMIFSQTGYPAGHPKHKNTNQ